ncbi:MAG: hypothetical protein V3U15_02835 [Nitrospinota bacterium]
MATQTGHYEMTSAWAKGNIGGKYPFSEVNEPGTYVANWSGHLMRFSEDSLKPGRSPLMDMVAKEPLYVTKISENPYVAIEKARQIAADFDCNVNF